ncbi:hypothetical protein FQZ97_1272750 [compost metagenome]
MRSDCLQHLDYIRMGLPGRDSIVECRRIGWTIFNAVCLACPLNGVFNNVEERFPLTQYFIEAVEAKTL